MKKKIGISKSIKKYELGGVNNGPGDSDFIPFGKKALPGSKNSTLPSRPTYGGIIPGKKILPSAIKPGSKTLPPPKESGNIIPKEKRGGTVGKFKMKMGGAVKKSSKKK